MPIKLEVWGEYGCFTDPVFKTERVSYEVMTPSAARGILESVYWKPEIRWVIDEIHVLNPFKWMNIRRNEIESKVPYKAGNNGNGRILIEEKRQQRTTRLLCDVRYGIVAHFEMLSSHDANKTDFRTTDFGGKHLSIFQRRAAKGQCYHQPCFGCREFPAFFKLASDGFSPCQLPAKDRNRDLGWMLYDLRWPQMEAEMYHAAMIDGVLDVQAGRVPVLA
jgi:CRISPR-associated protein Cas5d